LDYLTTEIDFNLQRVTQKHMNQFLNRHNKCLETFCFLLLFPFWAK